MSVIDKASVVILAYNNLQHATIPCIESLYQATNINEFDLFLVDNGSSDGTYEYFKTISDMYENVTIIKNNVNLGFSRGNNIGILSALNNEYIFIVNNDVLFTELWLKKLVDALKSKESVGIVSPVTNFCDKSSKQYVHIEGITINNYKNLSCNNLPKSTIETERLIFFCVGFKRSVVFDVGLLDEKFSPCWFEDDDYCLRAKYFGYSLIVVSDCFVYHNHSQTSSSVVDGNLIFEKNRKHLQEKHSEINFRFLDKFFRKKSIKTDIIKKIITFKIGRYIINVSYDRR